jgi:hypothetical protein
MRPLRERAVRRPHLHLGQQAQQDLPLGFDFAEEDFGDCGHGKPFGLLKSKT